jgi:nucleoside-diphosphate kinase
MKEAALIIIKPDGIRKKLVGNILNKFAQTDLKIVAVRIVNITRKLAEKHYMHLKNKPFFNDMVSYFCGEYHKERKLLTLIYYGKEAIKKCRNVAGETNPEDARPESIRGSFGRITTKGLFENVVHVSSDKKEAEREIKLWFDPSDIAAKLYPTKIKVINAHKSKVWL